MNDGERELSEFKKKRDKGLIPYKDLIDKLDKDQAGYIEYQAIPGRGLCALLDFVFTVGLVVGIEESSYHKRYCYPKPKGVVDAFIDLLTWDGEGDPKGSWIKCKGRDGEYGNPNYLNKN